jgi:hypothetical protein
LIVWLRLSRRLDGFPDPTEQQQATRRSPPIYGDERRRPRCWKPTLYLPSADVSMHHVVVEVDVVVVVVRGVVDDFSS